MASVGHHSHADEDLKCHCGRNSGGTNVPGWNEHWETGEPPWILGTTETCVSELVKTYCCVPVYSSFICALWKGIFESRQNPIQETALGPAQWRSCCFSIKNITISPLYVLHFVVTQAHSHHNLLNFFQLSPLSLPSFYQKNRHYIYYIICLLAWSFKHNSIQSYMHQSHGVFIIMLPVLHLLSTWWHSRANDAPWSFGPWVNQVDGKL